MHPKPFSPAPGDNGHGTDLPETRWQGKEKNYTPRSEVHTGDTGDSLSLLHDYLGPWLEDSEAGDLSFSPHEPLPADFLLGQLWACSQHGG